MLWREKDERLRDLQSNLWSWLWVWCSLDRLQKSVLRRADLNAQLYNDYTIITPRRWSVLSHQFIESKPAYCSSSYGCFHCVYERMNKQRSEARKSTSIFIDPEANLWR